MPARRSASSAAAATTISFRRSSIASAGRGEFYTSYTPYQPEVEPGQPAGDVRVPVADRRLTGLDVANASLYDGGSAAAEAVLMAMSVHGTIEQSRRCPRACIPSIGRRSRLIFARHRRRTRHRSRPSGVRRRRQHLAAAVDDRHRLRASSSIRTSSAASKTSTALADDRPRSRRAAGAVVRSDQPWPA